MEINEIRNLYQKEIKEYKPLVLEEIDILVEKSQQGDIVARQRLICSLQRAIISVVVQYYKKNQIKPTDTDFMECVMEGNLGLQEAIDNFDPKIRVYFITYAKPSIKYAILKFIKDFQYKLIIPDAIRRKHKTEMAEYLEIIKYTYQLQYINPIITGDKKIFNQGADNRVDLIYEVLSSLSEKNQEIYKKIYGLQHFEKMKQKDIAEIKGVSEERISQIKKQIDDKIIEKIRKM